MKTLAAFVALCLATASSSIAGEPGWIETYQPLGGTAGGGVHVSRVKCIAKFASTDDDKILPMMAATWPYHPPNDVGFDRDHNVASASGLKIDITYGEQGVTSIVLDASGMADDKDSRDAYRNIVMGLLECLRLVTPKALQNVPLVAKGAKEGNKEWLDALLLRYKAHDKSKEFWPAAARE